MTSSCHTEDQTTRICILCPRCREGNCGKRSRADAKDQFDILVLAIRTCLRFAAGKTSAAIEAALEAVRKHWIEKEVTQGGGGALSTPVGRQRPGDAVTTTGGAPSPGSLRSSSGTLADRLAPKSPTLPAANAAPAGGGGGGGSGAASADGSADAVPAAEGSVAAAATGQSSLAAKLANKSVSKIFSGRVKQLDRITEADSGLGGDDDEN